MINRDWHRLDPARVILEFRSDASSGLSRTEAARRLTEHGPNELKAAHKGQALAHFSRPV